MTTERYFDGREMVMAHDVFRREFGLLPSAIRAVPAGDAARSNLVAEHAQLICGLLDHHHHLEEISIWPTLVERSAPQVAPVVQAMEEQHAAIASIGAEIGEALIRWQVSASAEDQAKPGCTDRLRGGVSLTGLAQAGGVEVPCGCWGPR